MKRLLWLLMFSLPVVAQVNNPSVRYVATAPSGACASAPPIQVVDSTGTIYTCDNGTWASQGGGGGSGTVTSVALTINAGSSSGIFAVSGSPVTTSGTLNYNLTGTSGGLPYFSSASVLSSSAAMTANLLVKGGGAGSPPAVSQVTDDGTNPTVSPLGFNIFTAGGYDYSVANAGTTGTTAQTMSCDNGSGAAVVCPHATSTTNVPVGFTVSGAGTTGNSVQCNLGWCSVKFDNQTTARHYAIESTTVDGELHDNGTALTAGQANFFIWSVNAGAGTAGQVRMLIADDYNNASPTSVYKLQVAGTGLTAGDTVNFNATTPAAGTNGLNITFQTSKSGAVDSVSGEVVGDGTSTHYLSGAGTWTTPAGGGLAFPATVSGTTTSGGIPYFSSTTTLTSSAILTTNILIKGGGAGGAPSISSVTDNGTTVTSTDTGGYVAPVFVANGTTAGFMDFPEGTTSAAVAPCNTATSICIQAPAAVTSYVLDLPPAQPGSGLTAISCTAANPTVCTFIAPYGAGSTVSVYGTDSINLAQTGATSTVSGVHNTSMGYDTLNGNTSGNSYDTAVGYLSQSQTSSSGAGQQSSFGALALYEPTSGTPNDAFGFEALEATQSGSNNAGFGWESCVANTTGSGNTCIGQSTGGTAAGSNSTFLGYKAGTTTNSLTNLTVIGYNAVGTASNQIVLGNSSVTALLFAGITVYPIVRGTGTFTTATSDAVTVTGATSSSICTFSPTNSTAAASTTIGYISSVTTNSVTITHVATTASGGTVNVQCTLN